MMITPCASEHEADALYEKLTQEGKKNVTIWMQFGKWRVEHDSE